MRRLNLSLDLKLHLWSYLILYSVNESIGMTLAQQWVFSLYDYMFDKYVGWGCPSMSLDAKRDIWTYLVLNSVNINYWDDPCRKKVILAYMVANLINGMVEIVPWFKTWYVNIFYFVFGKMKDLECSLSRKVILAYMLQSLRNKKVELVL